MILEPYSLALLPFASLTNRVAPFDRYCRGDCVLEEPYRALASGVPGKLYCVELYLYFALIQPNTKAGLVTTRAGEKFLTGDSITVVIFILTTRVIRGNEGKPDPWSHDFQGIASGTELDPGLAPGQGSRGGYTIAAFWQDVCFATDTNTVHNCIDTCSQGLDFASLIFIWHAGARVNILDPDVLVRLGMTRKMSRSGTSYTSNIGEASISLLVKGNANRT